METRVSRLEEATRDVKSSIAQLGMTTMRIETMLATTLPGLATKAGLAEKPSKTCMWGIVAMLLTAYACRPAELTILK